MCNHFYEILYTILIGPSRDIHHFYILLLNLLSNLPPLDLIASIQYRYHRWDKISHFHDSRIFNRKNVHKDAGEEVYQTFFGKLHSLSVSNMSC